MAHPQLVEQWFQLALAEYKESSNKNATSTDYLFLSYAIGRLGVIVSDNKLNTSVNLMLERAGK